MNESQAAVYDVLRNHVRRQWPTREQHELSWELGPIRSSLPRFRACRVSPGQSTDPWVYISLGAWEVPAEERLELFILSPIKTPRHVETLAMVANFHADPRYRLREGKVLNIGHGWLEGSPCDHLLISVPYPLGPSFESCPAGNMLVRFLWLLPITAAEAEFARKKGHHALEDLLEGANVETLDAFRPSVV